MKTPPYTKSKGSFFGTMARNAKTRGRSNELSSSLTIETHQTSAIQLEGVFFDTIANALWFFILPFASKPETDQTSFTNNGATHVSLRLISKAKRLPSPTFTTSGSSIVFLACLIAFLAVWWYDSWNNISCYKNSYGKGPYEAWLISYNAHHITVFH